MPAMYREKAGDDYCFQNKSALSLENTTRCDRLFAGVDRHYYSSLSLESSFISPGCCKSTANRWRNPSNETTLQI